ncbi:MAG: GPW/gp25 family protein [Gallionella sp.]|nr:GPW/gp25 family protein [Gallionella sp.]
MTDYSDPGKLFGRGLGFPPRVGADGRVAWSEGEANVRDCLRILLLTEPRERMRLPNFGGGLTRFLFEPNTPGTRQRIRETIEENIKRWEPRVRIDSVTVDADPQDAQGAVATIAYRLVATQALERVTLALTLKG